MTAPASAGNSPSRQSEPLRAQSLGASLTVKDIAKSMAWYRDVLGFTVEQQHEREGSLRSARMTAGAVRILLNQDDGALGKDRAKGAGFSLMLTTDQNVDEIARRIRESGTKLESEPADMPWGMRMFRVHDPDGFKLAFGSLL